MGNRDIKVLFREAEDAVRIDEKKKEKTVELLKREMDTKDVSPMESKVRIWKNQFLYMDKRMLLIQIAECLFMVTYVILMGNLGMEREDIIVSSMILSAVQGILWLSQIGRLFYSNIAELAESCYFNTKQMAAFSMAGSGLISLAMLLIVIVFVGYEWKIGLWQVGLYILVPFVYAECCCLGILLTETGRRNPYMLAAAGAFSVVLQIVVASVPRIYQISAIFFWGAAFVLGIALLGMEAGLMLRKMERGEILCMN